MAENPNPLSIIDVEFAKQRLYIHFDDGGSISWPVAALPKIRDELARRVLSRERIAEMVLFHLLRGNVDKATVLSRVGSLRNKQFVKKATAAGPTDLFELKN